MKLLLTSGGVKNASIRQALVDLLTEGWRSLNARLDRIEAQLGQQPGNVVPLHGSAA